MSLVAGCIKNQQIPLPSGAQHQSSPIVWRRTRISLVQVLISNDSRISLLSIVPPSQGPTPPRLRAGRTRTTARNTPQKQPGKKRGRWALTFGICSSDTHDEQLNLNILSKRASPQDAPAVAAPLKLVSIKLPQLEAHLYRPTPAIPRNPAFLPQSQDATSLGEVGGLCAWVYPDCNGPCQKYHLHFWHVYRWRHNLFGCRPHAGSLHWRFW